MRARPDVPELVDGRLVAWHLRQRAPEEVLVEAARAGVDVAVLEVDVERGDVGGGEGDAAERGRLEILDVPSEARHDTVGVRLAELLRPGAVAGVELAGGVPDGS